MKTIIVMTLVVSSVVTGIYQHTQYRNSLTAERAALTAKVKAQGRLWGAKQEAAYWKDMAERMTREVDAQSAFPQNASLYASLLYHSSCASASCT